MYLGWHNHAAVRVEALSFSLFFLHISVQCCLALISRELSKEKINFAIRATLWSMAKGKSRDPTQQAKCSRECRVCEIDRAATCDSHSRVWLGTAFVQSCSNVFQERSTQGTWPSGNLNAPTMHSFQPAGRSFVWSYCRSEK